MWQAYRLLMNTNDTQSPGIHFKKYIKQKEQSRIRQQSSTRKRLFAAREKTQPDKHYGAEACDSIDIDEAQLKVCKRRITTPCHNHVKDILYKMNICTKDMLYEQQYENVAKSMFMQQYNKIVRPSGLFIDEESEFLAGSPDGIIVNERAVVEIKCFPSLARTNQKPRGSCTRKEELGYKIMSLI
ncbi:unnamed protein product [Parnassius apollo]|uniref:(apollo) hypothetical protein n=1 Tax=Parnassius apollo TaxID=110799 RepID=A0A8S3XAI6_PARAO|nr:unnamed protein product [Parnassius apollo]